MSFECVKDYIERVDKVWGRECWIVNNELYCAKILHVTAGGASSIHYHVNKDETFHVLEGSCYFYLTEMGKPTILTKGDTVRIRPGVGHGFACLPEMTMGCKILEISTHHDDNDVVRLEESKRL